jgi:hypothetical protein
MNSHDDVSLRDFLRSDQLAADPAFVERTHRVVAVEALAHLEGVGAWRSCVRDVFIAVALVAGMVISSLWALHSNADAWLLWPMIMSVGTWALLHDWSMPELGASADE